MQGNEDRKGRIEMMTLEKPRSDERNLGSASVESQTTTEEDDYDAKVLLIQKAFLEISRLCFESGYTLTAEDWRALDEARLDDPALSFQELRARLAAFYKRIRAACKTACCPFPLLSLQGGG